MRRRVFEILIAAIVTNGLLMTTYAAPNARQTSQALRALGRFASGVLEQIAINTGGELLEKWLQGKGQPETGSKQSNLGAGNPAPLDKPQPPKPQLGGAPQETAYAFAVSWGLPPRYVYRGLIKMTGQRGTFRVLEPMGSLIDQDVVAEPWIDRRNGEIFLHLQGSSPR